MAWPRYLPRFGVGFTKSPAFEKLCRKSFDDVDVDKDGSLDFKELYLAILKLYDILNAKLPCHMRVPKTEEMAKLMSKYDHDKSGKLAFSEYHELCRGLVGAKHFWDSLFFKVVAVVALKVVAFPLAAQGVKAVVGAVGLPAKVDKIVTKVPNSLLSTTLEVVAKKTLPLPL